MTSTPQKNTRDMFDVFIENLQGADRVVVETLNALGAYDANYLHAKSILDAWNDRTPTQVKPLVWERGMVDWCRPMPGMKYVACSTSPNPSWAWWLDGNDKSREVYGSEIEAKAAAQADYTRRILEALT